MRVPEYAGKSLAAAAIIALYTATATSTLLAQSPGQLQGLVFYPAPLTLDAADAHTSALGASALLLATAGETDIDMASFEEGGIQSYQQNIAELQASEGPFAPALTQQLLSLGLLHQQLGEHDAAVDALERAAAVSRTNNGLYSPEQISLAEHSIESLRVLGRFAEVEDKYRFLVNLHQQYYGAAAPQTATALKGLGRWKLESFHHNLAQPDSGQMQVAREATGLFTNYEVYNTRFEELYQAQSVFVDALRVLIESGSFADPALFELEQDLIRTFYINANRELVINNPGSYAIVDESSHLQMRKKANSMALPEDYSKGEDAYRRMIGYMKKNPDVTIEQIADVMLGLGDWHLLFGKYERAHEQYRQLEQLLVKAETPPARISALLQPAVPVTLPMFLDSAISVKPLDDASGYKGYVDLALSLNRYGRVGSIDVLGSSSPTDSAITARLVSLARNAQFRPAGGNNGSVAGVRYYYTY
jgi:tetratricopeptide (TPR) repeat protein